MTELVLVRHGQASFGSDNYDELSALGVRQAMLLRPHWQKLRWEFDGVCSGTLERQVDTAMHAMGFDNVINSESCTVQIDPAFNEYDSSQLLRQYGEPAMSLQRLREDPRAFQQVLEHALLQWIADSNRSDKASWQSFNDVIWDSLTVLVSDRQTTDRIVVFTSAGVIACVLKQVLNLDAHGFLKINRRVFNASITHLNYGRSGFSLLGFNDVSALRLVEPELVTYR